MRRNPPLHGVKVVGSNMVEVDHGGVFVLYSYETPVAIVVKHGGPGGGPYVTEKVWSRTTSKHIGVWLRYRGYERGTRDPRVKRASQEEVERMALEGRREGVNPPVDPRVLAWRRSQPEGAIMHPETFGDIEREARRRGARDPRAVAGAAYWQAAEAQARKARRNPDDEDEGDDPYKHDPDEDYPYPGKFEGETWLAVQMHGESADEEAGSVEDIGWHGLYVNFEASDGSRRHGILRENDQGFVFLSEFESEKDAREAFEEISDEYDEWMEESEDDDDDYDDD